MVDKFKPYYIFVDHYILDKNITKIYEEESEPLKVSFFKDFNPFNMAILMRYIKNIVNNMCKNLILKNKVEEEIEKVKYNINNNINSCTIWKWKDITLVDLIKGELDFLKKNFIITNEMPIDKNSFINNNFIHPLNCEAYPFSLKELYYMLLYRGIFVSINNYYYLNNNNK
jgi:hypothetical protein